MMRRNILFCALALAAFSQAHAVCYVNAGAKGLNSGKSWADAYTDLQSALNDKMCSESWVAKGVYKPTSGADRSAHFTILPSMAIYGGFNATETARNQRDILKNVTVLSGDIDGDDAHAGDTNIDETPSDIRGNNSYNVVTFLGQSGAKLLNDTVLDGFTITGGFANGTEFNQFGAGIYCFGETAGAECSPTLSNLYVIGNAAPYGGGGGLFNDAMSGGKSSPVITNVSFVANWAQQGGAIFDYTWDGGTSSPTIANSVFKSNFADWGGAIYTATQDGETGNLTITNSEFSNNQANTENAGAIYMTSRNSTPGSLTITNSSFVQNWSAAAGGAIFTNVENADFTFSVHGSTFFGNGTLRGGGAISLWRSSDTGIESIRASVNNSTFSANHADGGVDGSGDGAAIELVDISPPMMSGSLSFDLQNSILWGDIATGRSGTPELDSGAADVTVEYSDIEKGCPKYATCSGVIEADPMFGPLGYYFGPTRVIRPAATSAVVNAGDDATCDAADQRGIARPQGPHCDMGAVELRLPSDDMTVPSGF